MDNLIDVLHATVSGYPERFKNELTVGKINLLIYLIDWHLRINKKPGISGLTWVSDSYGPSAPEIKSSLERRNLFEKVPFTSSSGRESHAYKTLGKAQDISAETQKSLRHVLNLNEEHRSRDAINVGTAFKRLVLSTYGIMHTETGDVIDIQRQASAYRKFKGLD